MIFHLYHFYHTTPELLEDSPFRIDGFHTLFYPKTLLGKDDLYELEKWIQIPFLSSFSSKDVFFFQQIKETFYLIVLRITRLPEARDIAGRKDGVYQCHGIICPPEIWQKIPSPLSVLSLVESRMFPNREAALASLLVNGVTGEMSPLEIFSEDLLGLKANFRIPQLTTFEVKLTLLVRRLAIGGFTEGRLLFHGEYQQVVSLINTCCLFIPLQSWVQLSFDPVLDGILLHPLPVKIAGCITNLARGGDPIYIDLQQEIIEGEVSAIFSRPLDIFEQWLKQKASGTEVNCDEIRNMMAVSDYLTKSQVAPFSGQLPTDITFLEMIHGTINKQFVEMCVVMFGTITQRALPCCPFHERFSIVMFGFPAEQLVEFKHILTPIMQTEPENKASTGKSIGVLKWIKDSLFKEI